MEFTLEKLEVYNIAEKFSDDIWDIVIKWDYFKKRHNRETVSKSCRFNFSKYCRRLWALFLQRE